MSDIISYDDGFSGAIASNIYRTQDKPRFIIGRV
jgi:hypothetical protein